MASTEIRFGKVANNPEAASAAPGDGTIEMGIKNAPARLIIGYLTRMYAYPLEAAIRETVSNALDAAAREGAGCEAVRAYVSGVGEEPFPDSSVVCVRDHGCGMTYDTLVNVYTQYGVSDKRDDADQTGAFGLGAKSPLAYTDEMHVFTSTGEGAYYVHAYRTRQDDFRADLPVELGPDGAVVADNLVLANAGDEISYEVGNPFADGGAGTLVCFPLACDWASEKKARGIIASVDGLLYDTGEGSITDSGRDDAPRHYKFGEYELADDGGDTIKASAFLVDDSSDPVRSWGGQPRHLKEIVEAMFASARHTLSMENIAFKVGCWLYPASGGAWKSDEISRYAVDVTPTCPLSGTYVIIDVPSKALPFLPSRDSIMADEDNGNAEWIASHVLSDLHEKLLDPTELTRMFNWATSGHEGYRSFGERFASVFPFQNHRVKVTGPANSDVKMPANVVNAESFEAECAAAKNRAVCSSVPSGSALVVTRVPKAIRRGMGYSAPADTSTYELALDLSMCDVVAGRTFDELLGMPAGMVAFVEARANDPKMKHGPFVVTPDAATRLLGRGSRAVATYSPAPGYQTSTGRTVADNVTAAPFQPVPARYSSKPDADVVKEGSFQLPNAATSLGLMMVNAFCSTGLSRSKSNIVIADCSEMEMSKARAAIGSAFEDAGVARDADGFMHDGLFVAIPPAGDGRKWDADEKAGLVSGLEELAGAVCDSVITMSADDMRRAAARKRSTRKGTAQRSEYDKMFANNRVVTLADPTAEHLRAALPPRYHFKRMPNLGAQIAKDPTSWAVIVVDGKGERPQEDGVGVAMAAFMMDAVQPGVTSIAVISSKNYNEERSRMLFSDNVEVIWDESGKTPYACRFERGDFKPKSISQSYSGTRVNLEVNSGVLPKEIRDVLVEKELRGEEGNLARLIAGGMRRSGYGGFDLSQVSMNVLVPLFTFGHEEYGPKRSGSDLAGWKRVLAEDIDRFGADESGTDAGEMARLSERLSEVAQVWSAGLEKAKMQVDIMSMTDDSFHYTAAAASAIGIEANVDALYRGVPVVDIIG